MPSPLYTEVVRIVTSFVGAEKGPGIVERQLKFAAGASADNFAKEHLQKIQGMLVTASKLYLADPSKFDTLKSQIAAKAV